jgi:hypothetical protein
MRVARVIAHVRALEGAVSSPAAAWLLLRMLAWSLVLPVLKRALPLPRLVALVHRDACGEPCDPLGEQRVVSLSEWVFRSRPRSSRDNCLERALVTYRYLGCAGAKPTLVVGMARDEGEGRELAGHVWVTVDGTPVHDDAERIARFASVVAFSADGRAISTGAATPNVESRAGRPRTATPPPEAPPR